MFVRRRPFRTRWTTSLNLGAIGLPSIAGLKWRAGKSSIAKFPHLSSERGESLSREQKVAVVDAYLNCLLTKDLSKVRFADDVTFEGPRMPKLVGKQSVIGFLKAILPMIKDIRLKQHIVEGDYVATVFDMETINGIDHVFDRIQVVDEEIKGIQAFYYPQQP